LRREEQETTIAAASETLKEALGHAQSAQDGWRLRALADGDPEATAAYAQATVDARNAADQLAENEALLRDIAADLERLRRDRPAVGRVQVRAELVVDAEEAQRIAREIDAAARALQDGWQRLKAIRVRQLQRAADANLPDNEIDRYHNYRPLRRALA